MKKKLFHIKKGYFNVSSYKSLHCILLYAIKYSLWYAGYKILVARGKIECEIYLYYYKKIFVFFKFFF